MKDLTKVFAALSILLIIYAIIGKLAGQTAVSFGITNVFLPSVLIMANFFMLVAILIKVSSK